MLFKPVREPHGYFVGYIPFPEVVFTPCPASWYGTLYFSPLAKPLVVCQLLVSFLVHIRHRN
jgi:hypothetical protein